MSMIALPTMLACLFAGVALGTAYFGLLLLSVRLLIERSRSREFVQIALLRGALVFVALSQALALGLGLAGLLAGCAGFLFARLVLTQISIVQLDGGGQCK